MVRSLLLLSILCPTLMLSAQNDSFKQKPVRMAIVGLVHTHVHWVLGREKQPDIEIVGIAEPNRELAGKYAKQHGYSMDLVYSSMEEMIEKTKPEAVLAFNTIYDHLKVVEYCAPRGIHVMVEKPLAVNLDHARKMLDLARKHKIHLLTNYETTWYGSNARAYDIIHKQKSIGELRKFVFHTGHPGPIEIGCNAEFLEWLTDPVLNGGGALTDFGCYGANVATWLMQGEKPLSVTAVTQQVKPHLYPKVEDEATIVITYPKAQVIIQASWNWPYNRKDMEVYGVSGYVICKDRTNMLVKDSAASQARIVTAPDLGRGYDDPFGYFARLLRGRVTMKEYDLSAPANNEIVMGILEAATRSAKSGQTVKWSELSAK